MIDKMQPAAFITGRTTGEKHTDMFSDSKA